MSEIRHVVLFSGGIGSWATAKRVAERYGIEGLVLLFTDTLSEDADTYRALIQGAANILSPHVYIRHLLRFASELPEVGAGDGVPLDDGTPGHHRAHRHRQEALRKLRLATAPVLPGLVWLAEGRDIWQVFEDHNMMGSTRVDMCSRELKRELSHKYIFENCDPENTTVYVGIDWSEAHRFRRLERHWQPYRVEAPMTEAPYLTKQDVIAWAESEGLRNQRLYEMGFRHANCGGFCVKMGHAGAKHLLRSMPERYAYHEKRERDFRARVGKDVSILRDRRDGVSSPLTLEALRKRVETQDPIDELDWGSCACVEPSDEEIV